MDSHKMLVIIKGKDRTDEIADIRQEAACTRVTYLNRSKPYSYHRRKCLCLSKSEGTAASGLLRVPSRRPCSPCFTHTAV